MEDKRNDPSSSSGLRRGRQVKLDSGSRLRRARNDILGGFYFDTWTPRHLDTVLPPQLKVFLPSSLWGVADGYALTSQLRRDKPRLLSGK